MSQRTLPQLFEDSVKKFGKNVFMWEKRTEKYEGTTYAEMQTLVHEFAAGLLVLGLKKGDRVALIADAGNSWVMSELGILFTGAVNVPVSVRIEELADLKFRLAHSGCRMVVVTQSQLAKIRAIKHDLGGLEKVIVLNPQAALDSDEIAADDIRARGAKYLKSRRAEFDAVWTSVLESDFANICYTSGTTADPKGIILTHRNYTANFEQANTLIDCPEWYRTLLVLPWDHAFGHTCGIYIMMRNGASLAAVQQGKTQIETLKNFPINMKEIKPTIMLSAPALAKNFKKNIDGAMKKKGPRIEGLYKKALALAYDYNGDGWTPRPKRGALRKLRFAFYDKLLFKKVRAGFGGELRFFVGGAALLDLELQKYFYAIGLPMYQGYGLTEAAPVISSNAPDCHKLGTSGRPVKGLELKICGPDGRALPVGQRGEIVVNGENVMAGYWKNEKATREVLRDGWLYTGDIGYLDQDGFLNVLGRVKSLLIANDGEKYSPEEIEEAFIDHSPFIEQVMLYNNQSPYTVALVVPNKEAVRQWLKDKNLSVETREGQAAVLKLLESEIGAYREGGKFEGLFPPRWLPAAVAVLGEPFTEQNGFLNFLGKLVRGRVTEYYKPRIDHMFTTEGKDIVNSHNLTIVSRF
jgi:long-chain acyl-CoA synthetase